MRYTLPTLDGTHEADVARLDAWSQLPQTPHPAVHDALKALVVARLALEELLLC